MVLCVLSAMAADVSRAAEPVFDIDIPAMNAAEALNRLAEQTGSVMLFSYDLARAREANAVRGRYTLLEGLELLLRDTGLSGGLSDKRVVIIAANGNVPGGKGESVKKRGLLAALIAALFGSTAGESNADQTEERPRQETPIEEIIVTAQKRQERLQDVPVPVTVIGARSLVESNQVRVQDYFSTVPGLNLQANPYGDAFVSIRGLVTLGGNPAVGATIDDVPYGTSSSYGGSYPTVPDIDPNDLKQIEVLRGPQGTFYGTSSIGGMLKYVTVEPSTESLTGQVRAGTSAVESGDDLGYNVHGALNIPLSDSLAVRGSVFSRRDSGFVDDPGRGLEDVNSTDVHGGRLAARWQRSETSSLKLSALFQKTDTDATNYVDVQPGSDVLQQSALRSSGVLERKIQAYSAIFTAQLAGGELTSVSGYNVNEGLRVADLSPGLGPIMQDGIPGTGFDGFGVSGASSPIANRTAKLSQEIRLASALGAKVDWLAGLFYTDEDSKVVQDILAVDMATGEPAGSFVNAVWLTTFKEYAAFANVTFHITERLDLQIGGRESENRQTYSEVDAGLYGPVFFGLPDPIVNPEVKTKDSSFTYLVTPQLKVSPDHMVYARIASGYRAGGPNPTAIVFGVPLAFKPDTTRNYEIGAKGNAFGHKLAYDASIFYIDWNDIQLPALGSDGVSSFSDNGSAARSQGAELSLDWRPLERLKIGGWVAFNEAEVAESPPEDSQLLAEPGDRLPYSSSFSGSVAMDWEFPVLARMTGLLGASVTYVGNQVSRPRFFFEEGLPPPPELPGYTKADLRLGLQYDDWAVNAFINNVTDKRGVLFAEPFNETRVLYIQPRTIGLSIAKTF